MILHPISDASLAIAYFLIFLSTVVALALLMPKLAALRSRPELELLKRELESTKNDLRLAEADTATILQHLDEGVIVFGSDLKVVRHNAAAERNLQATRGEIERWDVDALRDIVDAEGVPIGLESHPIERALATRVAQLDVVLGTGSKNNRRWLAASATPVQMSAVPDGFERIVLCVRDITRLKETEVEQRGFARRLRMLHTIATATSESDRDHVDSALGFALEELGLDQAYLGAIDERTNELVIHNVVARSGEPTYGAGRRYPLAETLIGRVVDSELVLAAPDVVKTRDAHGIEYADEWKSFIAVAIRLGGQRYGAIGFKGRFVRDEPFSQLDTEFVQITGSLIAASVERRLQLDRLDALAFYDSLTGLPNRVLLADRLAQCIISAKRQDTRFALLFLDLDGFKGVNDLLGHAAGDDFLKNFASQLTCVAREGDTVARLGGDEFVILAPHIETVRDAEQLAQRVIEDVCRSVVIDGHPFALTASIGISLFPDNGLDADTLLACADAAMFEAKSRGKGCIRLAPAMTGCSRT